MTESKIKNELKQGTNLSIINLVNYVIEYAHHLNASDIHIDPTDNDVRIRFRIDGVLTDAFIFPRQILDEVTSRIKVLANLRTDEHQAAQDGRFRNIMEDAGPVDIRASIIPSYYGESVVLRLLAESAEQFDLKTLGFSKTDEEKILFAVSKPNGMILATGPTGSGKTTTLYTLIKMLNAPEISIITVEDPIEYAVKNIKQIQVNTRTGLTFANGLRSILRQDPDVIMVGEIRDVETANIAVNTALTGHLLLSTLHTNDAATILPRLLDMRIEPYLIASTVNIAIAQRLVRKICNKCKTEKKMSDTEKVSLQKSLPPSILNDIKVLYSGKGCDACNETGYKGRIGISEVLLVDNDLREAILRKASANEMKALAIKNGMTPMIEDGLQKVMAGLTTVNEVLRVAHE